MPGSLSDASPPATDSPAIRARHLALSLVSLGAPAVGAFLALPLLVSRLSSEAFGLLTMYWVIIGYANLVELGMGKAVAKQVAENPPDADQMARQIIGTAFRAAIVIGLLTGLLIAPVLHVIFGIAIEIPATLASMNSQSIIWIAATVPIMVIASILAGALEARRDFGWLALIRIPTGLALFLVPGLLAVAGFQLPEMVAGIMVVRVLLLLLLTFRVEHIWPRVLRRSTYAAPRLRSLLGFGGWLTISAIIGPLLVYLDRFILASAHGLATTALYTTAFETVIRFLVAASAVVAVMFPRFANLRAGDIGEARRIYGEANIYILIAVIPVAGAFIFFGDMIFSRWLSSAGLDSGALATIARTAAILSVGLVLNACAHIPQAFIQARGYPHWTAGLHIAEITAFLIYAPLIVSTYGVEGAAWTWLIRSAISALLLYILAGRLIRRQSFA
jgi:O-antigen/teichoic acid export membrane protein